MKFSDKTLTVLKNFSTINHGILFRSGSTLKTISPQKTIMANIDVEETFEKDFAIYDLPRFLGVLSLFENPEIVLGENQATIVSDKRKLVYTYSDPTTFTTPPVKEVTFPETTIKFTLANDDFQKVQRAANVLQLPETIISGDGTDIYLTADDSKVPTKDKYSIVVGKTTQTFSAVFKNENMKLLPSDYTVEISERGISRFTAKGIMYYIATEATSSFS